MSASDHPLDQTAIIRRVAVYGASNALHATPGQMWALAGTELPAVIREFWMGVQGSETDRTANEQSSAVLAQNLVEATGQRWTSPIDADWVTTHALAGSRLHELSLPMCDIANNIARLNIRLGAYIAKRFEDDQVLVIAAIQSLQWLGLVEFEVMSAAPCRSITKAAQCDRADQRIDG